MPSLEFFKFMLPDLLVDHFAVVSTSNTEETSHLYFIKKAPQEFSSFELAFKVFFDAITIQDFPLR